MKKIKRDKVKAVFYCTIEEDKERDMFIASFPDIPSVNTYGINRKHAIDWAREALEGCLECDLDRGFPMPESKYVGDEDCRIEIIV